MPCIGNSFNGIRIFNLSLKVPVAVQQSPPRILPSSLIACAAAPFGWERRNSRYSSVCLRKWTDNTEDTTSANGNSLPSDNTALYEAPFIGRINTKPIPSCTDSNLAMSLPFSSSTPFTFAGIPFSSSALKATLVGIPSIR